MYLKIKMIKPVKNKFGKNDLMISQIQAIDETGKFIKAVKLTEELSLRLKDSPIIIEQTEDLLTILD